MGNYRETNSWTWAGIHYYLPSTYNRRLLQEPVAQSSAADGMFTLDNSIYQVPTGKNFLGRGIKIWNQIAGGTVAISSGDTENAETALVYTQQLPTVANVSGIEVDCSFTIAAGKFVTIKPSSTTLDFIQIMGFEYEA